MGTENGKRVALEERLDSIDKILGIHSVGLTKHWKTLQGHEKTLRDLYAWYEGCSVELPEKKSFWQKLFS